MRRMILVLLCAVMFLQMFGQGAGKEAVDDFNIQALMTDAALRGSKTAIEKEENLTVHNLLTFRYTLHPQEDKDYKEYKVIKLDGLNTRDVMMGMITQSLEKETRYIEVKSAEQNAMLKEILDSKANYVYVNQLQKEYFIAPDGTFRYVDGRELVGDKKMVAYLEKGKPITAATFYFALRDKGLIEKETSLRTFLSMTLDEKVKLLKMDVYASLKETL